MSGIAGLLNLDGGPIDRQLLSRLTSFMEFRGPDAQEIWDGGAHRARSCDVAHHP